MKKTIHFGNINFEEDQAAFYRNLNTKVLSIWKGLSESLHSHLLKVFQVQAGYKFGRPFDMFHRYPSPIWSVIYWILKRKNNIRTIGDEEIDLLLTAHAMVMFLHGLDDHLNDGELAPGHLIILIRSEAWHILRESLNKLTESINEDISLCDKLIAEYYNSVVTPEESSSFEEYCIQTTHQMATAFIVPTITEIMCTVNDSNTESIRKSMEQLGIAWRLLDDYNDIKEDIESGTHSAVYFLLPDEGKELWNSYRNNTSEEKISEIKSVISEKNIPAQIEKEITNSLTGAIEHAENCDLIDLAEEFKMLSSSFK
jgi:hypothetical protein